MENITKKFITEEKLPLVYEAKPGTFTFETFLTFVENHQEQIEADILQYGGILLRGFPIDGSDNFNTLIDTLGLGKPLNYIGGDTPRDKVKGQVYTSTEAPPNFKIPLHNEMSFIDNYPRHIYFHCVTPPETGGETTIADARKIYQSLDRLMKKKFEKKGLRYISNFYKKHWVLDFINRYRRAHKTWMEAFETDDKSEVARLCAANNYGLKWNINDWLQVIYERPSVIDHPQTKERVWFNQAHLYDYNRKLLGFWNWLGTKLIYARKNTVMHEIYFGDGTKVPSKDLYRVMDILDQQTVKFPWQKGDVMVLDNVLAMHGRAPFTGKRRILAALTR